MQQDIFVILAILVLLFMLIYSIYLKKYIGIISFCIVIFYSPQIILFLFINKSNNNRGTIWMILLLFISIIAGILGSIVFNKEKKFYYKYEFDNYKLKIFIIICFIIAIINSLILLNQINFSLIDLIDFKKILTINTTMANYRYNEKLHTSLVQQITLVFRYLLALISGILYVSEERNKNKIIAFLFIIPSYLDILITNAKSGFITMIILFTVGIIISNLILNKKIISLNLKKIIKIFMLAFSAIVTMLISMMLRIGSLDIDTFKVVINKFISYALGHIFAFNDWLQNLNMNEYDMGFNTFSALFSNLGLYLRKQGIYQEVYQNNIIKTNVYTAFRPLIEDFGFIGSLIAIFVVIFVSLYFMNKIIAGKAKILYIVFYSSLLFYILYSFVTSIWVYTSFTVMFVMFYCILIICLKKEKNNEI